MWAVGTVTLTGARDPGDMVKRLLSHVVENYHCSALYTIKKMFQDPKMEIETLKKTQRETNLAMENIGKRSSQGLRSSLDWTPGSLFVASQS